MINLSQFTSLFEIGFALHFAVAFIDRIYARELPVRLENINLRAKALERFRDEIQERVSWANETNNSVEVTIGYRKFENPIWMKHNEQVLDRLYALRQDTNGQMRVLKRILSVITFLSILVVFYSVTMLFLIGLEVDYVMGMEPMMASIVVLMQLLPLPVAAGIFFFVARRMSSELDRKIRGVGELNVMLSPPGDNHIKSFASVEQVYLRDLRRNGFKEKN